MPAAPGERILVVDDDPHSRKLTAIRLRSAGFEVVSVSSAEDALQRIRSAPPDAVLSDVQMVGMTGIELRDVMRKDMHLAQIPIVLLSSAPELYQRQGTQCCPRTPDLREAIEALVAVLRRVD